MYVNDLIIEVGRNCPMRCPHCLRGDAENLAIDFETAKKIIDNVDAIGNITFTGGEPMLYAAIVIKIIDYIMSQKKSVDSFYIATSGKVVVKKLIFKLAEFYGYIVENNGDETYSQLDFSFDQFHEKVELPRYLKAFSFVHYRSDIPEGGVINEGRAQENGIGRRPKDPVDFYIDDDCVEMLYVNAKGSLLPDCDYSYETQEELTFVSVNDISDECSLLDVVKRYNEEFSRQNSAAA